MDISCEDFAVWTSIIDTTNLFCILFCFTHICKALDHGIRGNKIKIISNRPHSLFNNICGTIGNEYSFHSAKFRNVVATRKYTDYNKNEFKVYNCFSYKKMQKIKKFTAAVQFVWKWYMWHGHTRNHFQNLIKVFLLYQLNSENVLKILRIANMKNYSRHIQICRNNTERT